MDAHLEGLAPKHFDTKFLRINVDNAPFLVARLKIKVLPCVLAFVDGVSVDRIIGFEGLGNGDAFSSTDLEDRLLLAGVLLRNKAVADPAWQRRQRTGQDQDEDSGDDDW
ncbi:MAG: hypothetical protein M4579_007685 [Chaenotheca gracillima]|nr:MAG: hypothetical protein M4579_007685 [Chaenotheca gracillima]